MPPPTTGRPHSTRRTERLTVAGCVVLVSVALFAALVFGTSWWGGPCPPVTDLVNTSANTSSNSSADSSANTSAGRDDPLAPPPGPGCR